MSDQIPKLHDKAKVFTKHPIKQYEINRTSNPFTLPNSMGFPMNRSVYGEEELKQIETGYDKNNEISEPIIEVENSSSADVSKLKEYAKAITSNLDSQTPNALEFKLSKYNYLGSTKRITPFTNLNLLFRAIFIPNETISNTIITLPYALKMIADGYAVVDNRRDVYLGFNNEYSSTVRDRCTYLADLFATVQDEDSDLDVEQAEHLLIEAAKSDSGIYRFKLGNTFDKNGNQINESFLKEWLMNCDIVSILGLFEEKVDHENIIAFADIEMFLFGVRQADETRLYPIDIDIDDDEGLKIYGMSQINPQTRMLMAIILQTLILKPVSVSIEE